MRLTLITVTSILTPAFASVPQSVRWDRALNQPAAWYGTQEARAITDSVLAWQFEVVPRENERRESAYNSHRC